MHFNNAFQVSGTSTHSQLACCRYVLQTYIRPKFVLERGEGVNLWDSEGKQYLDFAAGIAVNSLGGFTFSPCDSTAL